MAEQDHPPGAPARKTGRYRMLNVFGSDTEVHAHIARGEPLPRAPAGHSWRLVRKRKPMATFHGFDVKSDTADL